MEKEELFSALRLLGVTEVDLYYNGSGDEGNIDRVDFTPKECDVSRAITNNLEIYVYGVLDEYYPGWELDDGAYGEVFIRITPDNISIKIIHNQAEVCYDTTHTSITI